MRLGRKRAIALAERICDMIVQARTLGQARKHSTSYTVDGLETKTTIDIEHPDGERFQVTVRVIQRPSRGD